MKKTIRNIRGILFLVIAFISLIIPWDPYPAKAAENPPDRRDSTHLRLRLEHHNFLIIHGRSNVNTFQCEYQASLKKDTLELDIFRKENCLVLKNVTVHLNSGSFDCGNKKMNHDFRDLLQHKTYPDITITVDCIMPETSGSQPKNQKSFAGKSPENVILTASITIAGISRKQKFQVHIDRDGNERIFKGNIPIKLENYQLTPPTRLLGLIRVEDNIQVQFLVKIEILDA